MLWGGGTGLQDPIYRLIKRVWEEEKMLMTVQKQIYAPQQKEKQTSVKTIEQ